MPTTDYGKLFHFLFVIATDPTIRAEVAKLVADLKAIGALSMATPPTG